MRPKRSVWIVLAVLAGQFLSACTAPGLPAPASPTPPAPTATMVLPTAVPAPIATATEAPTATPQTAPAVGPAQGTMDHFEGASTVWKAALPPTCADSSAGEANLTGQHVAGGKGGLELAFEKNRLPKAIFILENPLDLSAPRYLEFNVFNPDAADGVAIALSAGQSWEWHESQTVPLRYDAQTVTFDLQSQDWRSAATNWEYRAEVKALARIRRLAIIVFPAQTGSIFIDDVRLSGSPNGSLPVSAAAQATPTPLPQKTFTSLALRPLADGGPTFARHELAADTDGSVANPFDPAQADLKVRFTAPAGEDLVVPAFWHQDFDPQTLRATGEPGWRVRFTPDAAGKWTAQAELAQPALTSSPIQLPWLPTRAHAASCG